MNCNNSFGHPENANPEDDSMTFQEKQSLLVLGCVLIILIGYIIFLSGMINAGTLTTTNNLAFWAGVLLKLIGIQIGVNIVIMILFNIVLTIIATDRIPEKTDELDRQIEQRSTVIGSYVFFVGFLISMALAAFGLPLWIVFNVIVASFFAMQFTWVITQNRMYHRGF
jgi:hypothetical protein